MVVNVFPARNLPGLADRWGRVVEDRVVGLERESEVANEEVNSSLRAIGGSLSVLTQQLNELANRVSYYERADSLGRSTTINQGEVFLDFTYRTFTFNLPDGASRRFVATVAYDFSTWGSSLQLTSANNYVTATTGEFTQRDQGRSGGNPYWTNLPPGWVGESGSMRIPGTATNGVATVTVGVASRFEINNAPTGQTKTTGLQNIEVSIIVQEENIGSGISA